jgi:MoaE-MoaD fusion protein
MGTSGVIPLSPSVTCSPGGLPRSRGDQGDRVIVLPSTGVVTLVRLVREPIDVAALAGASPADGALCLFVGVVRNENQGQAVLRLEYEAYEEMALPLMEEIATETGRRFPVTAVRLVHRLGRLEVGETSVAVVVASPHRAEAFAACRFAIDTLKSKVPIWKKELYAEGSAWLDGRGTAGD